MNAYEELAKNAFSVAPLVEKAIGRKYRDVDAEEIRIAVTEGLASYCEAARKRTLHAEDNPAGFMWRTGVRCIHKYLLHHNRETPMGDSEYEYDVNDGAANYFEMKETLEVILSHIKNKSYYEMLRLHWLDELTFEEIAMSQARSIKAVYNCHERAMCQAENIAWHLGLRPPQQELCQTAAKINRQKSEMWWGKNWGVSIIPKE